MLFLTQSITLNFNHNLKIDQKMCIFKNLENIEKMSDDQNNYSVKSSNIVY